MLLLLLLLTIVVVAAAASTAVVGGAAHASPAAAATAAATTYRYHRWRRRCYLKVLTVLSGVAQSAYKMCGDVRLLANLKEVEEPFAKTQVPLYKQCTLRTAFS